MKIRQCISRRAALALGACAAASPLIGRAAAEAVPAVVVELFTSQGCSSCPPADEVLSGIRTRPGVVALAYHVDYWDYLGWKDTLGAPEFSQRQYDYAKARGDMDVYTPQAIINGGKHYVASNRTDLTKAVDSAMAEPLRVPVSLTDANGEIAIDVGKADTSGHAMVWLLPVQARVSVRIERGENAGKTFDYRCVVRRIVPAGMWSGSKSAYRLPSDTVMTSGSTGCVALVQRGKAGPILGVAVAGDLVG